MKKFVFTGGPGTGKTSTLAILAERGYNTMPEAAREIIDREQKNGSDLLPWKNHEGFQKLVAQRQNEIEEAQTSGDIFLDRSLVDGYAYSIFNKAPGPQIILDKGKNRYDKVFFFEQLPMYVTDGHRVEDIETAKVLHEMTRQAYITFGYEIIDVPVMSPEERADFVIQKVNE